MRVNELRIGNFIYYRDKESILTVTSLGYKFEAVNEICMPYGSDDIREFNPIPLTEEWLIKLGFIKNDSTTFEKNGYYFDLEDTTFYNDWPSNASTLNKNVQYLHQIQNLYFALTGEELITK